MGSQSTDYKFQGWTGLDAGAAEGNMKWQSYEPKNWEETDVDIKVTHCGICGSDLHTLRSGWMPTIYPCCVGYVGHIHEYATFADLEKARNCWNCGQGRKPS